MLGLCQLLTGLLLFVGLTWFQVFANDKVLYLAALAFSAYGIHWFALGWNRYRGNDPRPNAGMSVAFATISALGVTVFFHAGDWPVGLLFVGLVAVYVSDFFVALGARFFERLLGLVHVLTGLWLMYLMFAVTINFAAGFRPWQPLSPRRDHRRRHVPRWNPAHAAVSDPSVPCCAADRSGTVAFELLTLALIRWRFFKTGFLRSFASITLGGAIIAGVSAALGAAAS